MMMATKIWAAIEAIPCAGATRKHWEVISGSEWSALSPLLRATGLEAETIPCFEVQPGGCIRRIVRHSADNIRAACGEPGGLCKSEKLTATEAASLALDRIKLANGLERALQLTNGKMPLASQNLINLGHHYVHAGLGFPVFLWLGGNSFMDAHMAFADVEASKGGKLVLAPTDSGLGASAKAYLTKIGATVMSLDNLVGIDANGMIPLAPVEQMLATLRAEFDAFDDDKKWRLPADATWAKVTIEFRELHEIELQYKGVKPKRLAPQDLQLWDFESNRPKAGWEVLKNIPDNGGILKPLKVKARTQTHEAFKQIKKQLKEALEKVVPIPGDPFQYDYREKVYRPHFIVRSEALRSGKEGQNW
jgi:hypothetical protein